MTRGRWLVDIGIGPVAGFIAAGRRSRDLWWGSTWVSECTRRTALWLSKEHGAELVVPTQERVEKVGSMALAGDSLTYSGRVSNRIRALVSAGGPEDVERVVRDAEAEARRALAGFIKRSVRLEDLQLDGLSASDREKQKTRTERILGWLREVLDEKAFARQLDALVDGGDFLEFFAVWTPVEADGLFGEAYRQADELLSARKRSRLFGEPDWTEAGHRKSDLDAGRDSVLKSSPDPVTGSRSGASSTARRRLGIGPDEGLDAVGLARRIAALTRGPMLRPLPFPPLARIAADSWIEQAAFDPACRKAFDRLKDTLRREKDRSEDSLFFLWCSPARDPGEPVAERPESKGVFQYDASILFEGGIDAERAKIERLRKTGGSDQEEIEHALGVLEELREPIAYLHRSLGLPRPYYALLQMDGDNVGHALGEARDAEELKRCVRSLEGFADDAEAIIREHHGCAFYVGGDDLAAYMPADTATVAAHKLAQAFAAKATPVFRDLGLGSPSLSGGIVLAHVRSDLRGVRREAREALAAAKRQRRKTGSETAWLEVRDVPRSGSPRSCHGELEDLVDALELWTGLLGQEALSLRSAHELLAFEERFTGAAPGEDGGSLGLELAIDRIRAQQVRSTKETSTALPARLAEVRTWGGMRRRAVELLVADRIHDTRRHRRGPGEGGR